MTEDDDLHAREAYRPSPAARTPELALAQWTERMAMLSNLAAARELAGLSEDQLAAMALEFERAPRRARTDALRHSFTAAAVLALAGGVLALTDTTSRGQPAELSPTLLAAGACFVSAFVAVCAGIWSSFRLMPTEAAYAKLGLYVGLLNEQHPWLYKAYVALRNPAALNYRDKVLRERGPIRGMDYAMMFEIAEIQAKMELTQNARAVAASVQGANEVLASSAHVMPAVTQLAPAPEQAPAQATTHAPMQAPAPTLTAVPSKLLSLGSSTEAA